MTEIIIAVLSAISGGGIIKFLDWFLAWRKQGAELDQSKTEQEQTNRDKDTSFLQDLLGFEQKQTKKFQSRVEKLEAEIAKVKALRTATLIENLNLLNENVNLKRELEECRKHIGS